MRDEDVNYIVENYQSKTDKEISAVIGCHPSTIKHYRLDLGLLKRRTEILNCLHSDREVYSLGMCRSCYEKDLRQRNPEFTIRQRENSTNWAESHKEQKKQSSLAWVSNNLGKIRYNKWLWHIKTQYDISENDWDKLWTQQDGRCAICNQKPKYRLVVDHDHATSKVR